MPLNNFIILIQQRNNMKGQTYQFSSLQSHDFDGNKVKTKMWQNPMVSKSLFLIIKMFISVLKWSKKVEIFCIHTLKITIKKTYNHIKNFNKGLLLVVRSSFLNKNTLFYQYFKNYKSQRATQKNICADNALQ